jgi:Ca2+-transporting ATPase
MEQLIDKGLSQEQALKNFNADGANEIANGKKRSIFSMLAEIFLDPMFLLLFIAAILYLFLGELQEGAILLGFVIVSLLFTLYQEGKAERAIEALRDLTSPRSLVMREGVTTRIASRAIVKDDLVILSEGDRIPADGEIISLHELQVDESLLTGESLPVLKNKNGDELPRVYSGTLVVRGHGTARIMATGPRSKIGIIGKDIGELKTEKSPLNKQVSKLVTKLTIISISFSLFLIFAYGIIYHNWLQAVLSGIALAMAILPQEYVIVLTIFPALGARRLSKIQVLTRKLAAIETLGAVTVLCVDKTGTLTENSMTVTRLYVPNQAQLTILDNKTPCLPDAFHTLIELSILASEIRPYDPMEKAFHQFGQLQLDGTEHLHTNWELVREYGLTPELRAMSHVWKKVEGDEYVVAAKGSPEAIIDLCHLPEEEKNKIAEEINVMAQAGLRVLAAAEARFSGENFPPIEHDFVFKFSGLLGLSDPLRPEVVKSVEHCHEAGMKIVMITGDYPVTASSIAAQAGLSIDKILTGDLITNMSDEQLQSEMKTVNVCARISPEQKLRIVQALKANGEITAMTGDGVNDAPALKAAHVGIAMGQRGTDVARETASLILLDDNFISIVKAVQLGRRIFDNMQKSMTYILAIHIPIAGMALIPVLFGMPAMLFPMHIAFLEIVFDPACSLAFENEPEELDVMKRPPRDTNAILLGGRTLVTSLLQGFGTLLLVMGVYIWTQHYFSEQFARTFSFSVLVIANLSLIFSARTHRSQFFSLLIFTNSVLWMVVGISILFLLLILNIPFLAALFRFVPLPFAYMALALLLGVSSIIWFEVVKMLIDTKKL